MTSDLCLRVTSRSLHTVSAGRRLGAGHFCSRRRRCMTASQWTAWSMLMLCGLGSGVILTFQVERINLWARMPIEQYAVDFRRSLFRVDPMQPILGVLACIAAAYFGWLTPGTP